MVFGTLDGSWVSARLFFSEKTFPLKTNITIDEDSIRVALGVERESPC